MSNPILAAGDALRLARDEGEAILALAKSEHRAYTASERDKLAEVKAKIRDCEAEIQRYAATNIPDAGIGMTDYEARKFSVLRAVKAASEGDWRSAGLEKEASDAARQGRSPQPGFTIPGDILSLRASNVVKGTATSGGDLVATDLLAASFVDLLRNKLVCVRAGARILNGLTGDVTIPKLAGASTSYWGGEDPTLTSSGETFGLVSLSPKTCFGQVQISRRMLLQSTPAVEELVRQDIVATVAIAVDLAALLGSGSNNQPFGIGSTTSVGSMTGTGAATWTDLVTMEGKLAIANADAGALAYVTDPRSRSKWKSSAKIGTAYPSYLWADNGTVNGYPAFVSNQMTTGTAVGNCIFGNFNDLLIGQWGNGLDIITDPFSVPGAVKLTVLTDIDIAVRHPESFVVWKGYDIT